MHFRSVLTRSNVLSIAMVGLAGVITWYGLGGYGSASSPARQPVPAESGLHSPPPPVTPSAQVQGESTNTGLPTRVVVPAAGIDAPVQGVGIVNVDGEPQWETADRAVGHHLDSALPGSPGNLVLTGHVSVAARDAIAYFATLDEVRIGDIVEVHSGAAVHRYRIEDIQQVSPETTTVLRSDHRSRVTLITCTPDLQNRVVVVGTLVA